MVIGYNKQKSKGEYRVKLKTIRVENFLSLKDTTIHFDKSGVFHLYGANNIGKSAIVKAIRALFLNVSNTVYGDFLRDDCTYFKITGETWDGDVITLSRGSTDYYEWTIAGETGRMDRTSGKVPKEVRDCFNVYFDNQKTKECLNVRLPRSVLTYVDTTGGDNAHLIQKALGTEEFLLSMKLSESKRREVVKEKVVLEKYKEREEEKLAEVEVVLAEERGKLDRVVDFEKVLKAEYASYRKIEDVVYSARNLQEASNKLKEAKDKIKEMDTSEVKQELEDIKAIQKTLQTMARATKTNREKKELEEQMKELDTTELSMLLSELALLEKTLEEARGVVKLKKETAQAKEALEKSDKELGDFMREYRFCPIVARTLDKQCPFTDKELIV